MSKEKVDKRQLRFDDFPQMYEEIDSLMATGYAAKGNWNLSQVLLHIEAWLSYPMDGFPVPPIFIRPMFWLMRVTVGPRMLKNILADGFKSGTPTAPQSIVEPDSTSDADAYEKLRQTIDRAEKFDGEFNDSPLFGPMNQDLLKKLTLLHAAHHLGFLEPKCEAD